MDIQQAICAHAALVRNMFINGHVLVFRAAFADHVKCTAFSTRATEFPSFLAACFDNPSATFQSTTHEETQLPSRTSLMFLVLPYFRLCKLIPLLVFFATASAYLPLPVPLDGSELLPLSKVSPHKDIDSTSCFCYLFFLRKDHVPFGKAVPSSSHQYSPDFRFCPQDRRRCFLPSFESSQRHSVVHNCCSFFFFFVHETVYSKQTGAHKLTYH